MRAAEDVRYLVNRGYPKDSSVRFVSDHYRLPEEQRFVLIRVIVAAKTANLRKAKAVSLEALRGQELFVDGYNVLITVESLLKGRAIYLGDDGFLRDTQGIFRSYRASQSTAPALSQILDLLAYAAPARVEVLLDQQISWSGELAEQICEMMAERSLPGGACAVKDVDHRLKKAAVVATSDGNVIDAVSCALDIAAEIAKRRGIAPLLL
jgi:hypothetical protein